MIRHIAMFRWADEANDATKAEIAAGLDRLSTLDCVAEYRHGPDAALSEGNFDYVVVGDFDTIEDYRSYATNDDHIGLITSLIKPNIAGRAAIQFEVP